MGNFTSMTPGLTDVRENDNKFLIFQSLELFKNGFICKFRQLCSVLFIIESTYENLQLISQHNPSAFFYSFEYEGRNSFCNAFFIGNQPRVPHGMSIQ